MKTTLLTIITALITTLVAFNFLTPESGDKLQDVVEEVLIVQEAGEPTIEDDSDVATGAVSTGTVAEMRATPARVLSQ